MPKNNRRGAANGRGKARPRRRTGQNVGMRDAAGGRICPLPSIGVDTHSFVRTVAPVTLTPPVGSDYAEFLSFALQDLPSYTEFTSLFDSYVLDKVVVSYRWYGSSVSEPVCCFATSDYDGGTAPTLAVICQRRHIEQLLGVAKPTVSFSVTPRLLTSVYTTGATTVSSGVGRQWVDLASPSVQFNGAMVYLQNYNSGNSGIEVTRSATYHFRVRQPR